MRYKNTKVYKILVNKIVMKSFLLQNLQFGVDFKLYVPPPLMYKINTHNVSSVETRL